MQDEPLDIKFNDEKTGLQPLYEVGDTPQRCCLTALSCKRKPLDDEQQEMIV